MGTAVVRWSAVAVSAAVVGCALARARRSTPPVDEPNAWSEVDWMSHLGDFRHQAGRLHYCDFGDGPPLVLLHGMACSWQWWLECLPELGRHHRVIAVDLPGFGDSDPLPAPAEMAGYAGAVATLLRHLGIDRAAVAGHSMGGLVALALAEESPDLVARLVLVGSGGVPMSERHLRTVLGVLRTAHRTLTRRPLLRLIASNRTARRVLLRGAMHDPGVMSDALAALVAPQLDAPAFLDAIRASATAVRTSRPEGIVTPTALIWGELDPFAPVHTAEAMLDLLPNARLDVIPGVGHSPMVEAPAEFTRLLLRGADITDRDIRATPTC